MQAVPRLARAASHRPQKSATRGPCKRGPKTALGLGTRIRGRIGVGIGIGNCIGIGNGFRVKYLGKANWREKKTIRREKGRQYEETSRSKATGNAATGLPGHPEQNRTTFVMLD